MLCPFCHCFTFKRLLTLASEGKLMKWIQMNVNECSNRNNGWNQWNEMSKFVFVLITNGTIWSLSNATYLLPGHRGAYCLVCLLGNYLDDGLRAWVNVYCLAFIWYQWMASSWRKRYTSCQVRWQDCLFKSTLCNTATKTVQALDSLV